MKKTILTGLFLFAVLIGSAQSVNGYKTLDTGNPIIFGGDHIIYKGNRVNLGPKAFFIDGQFSDDDAAKYPYVFNSVNRAAEYLTNGTEESPMVLYIAPYVYWIDDPDDPEIRVGQDGQAPYGLIINCPWLRFYGLSDNPYNVVLACNRGQTIGSRGNFTMFRFYGDGTSSENITFGNYCNIDLIYPLKPELGREKRTSAIVQAQLIYCNGDKIVARNTNFISRLNLCPFVGGKRVLFDRCHFESTDDALCATGVYLNSTFDFYSSKPFYATTGTGAALLNCDIRSYTRGFWTFCNIEQAADSVMIVSPGGRDAWYYGEGTDGSAGQVGLLQGRFARMLYTPVGKESGNMKLTMNVTPSKTAGQGFSIAHLYMDVLIKFDNKTMSGYALRFIRTTKYGDAVDCMFVKYDNGRVTEISKPVSTSCYRPSCNITVEVKGNKIIAHADSPAEYYVIPDRPQVVKEVNIETEISPDKSGGFGIQYVGGASTMINELKVKWM
jgi:hypothetical protein